MNHITDFQLNEYLDHALDKAIQRQCDLHLSSCAECRARLEELKGLYSNLAELREVELSRDLTSSVLAHLPQSRPSLWTRIFAAQLGAALGALLFIIVEFTQAVHLPSVSTFQALIPEIRFVIPNFQLSTLYSSFTIINPFSLFSYSLFHLPQLPAFQIPFSNFQTSIIAIFTLLFGLVGNAILLCERSEVRK